MNRLARRMPRAARRVSPLLLVLFLPSAGPGLFFASDPAIAQDAPVNPLAQAAQAQPAPGQQQVPPGTPLIGKIVILGLKTLNEPTVLAFSGHKEGDPCTDATLDEIATNIYRSGYFGQHSATPEDAVRVKVEENNPAPGQCRVIVEVDENDTLRQVSVSGSGPISPDEIKSVIKVKPSPETPIVYNVTQFLADTLEIQNLYKSRGYAAVITDQSGPDEQNPGTLNVDILVARVTEIKVTGNNRTNRRVILREMKTKEGDYYNITQLNRDLQRLFNLDLFEDIIPEERTLGPGRVGLTISVVEKRTGTVSVGVGFSNRQQLVGRAEIFDTNFRGMGDTVSLIWETGGVAARNTIELGYTRPWLDKRNTTLGINLFDKALVRFSNNLFNASGQAGGVFNTDDNRYVEQRTGAQVTVSRPFREVFRGAISIRGENVRTDLLDLDPVNAQIIQNGPIFVLGGSIIQNTRDLDLDPISGAYRNLTLQIGQGRLNPVTTSQGQTVTGPIGSFTFTKGSADLRQYFSLQGQRLRTKLDEKKRAIALRLLVGSAVGTLPFFEQYFLGGAESLRGYREDRFWGKNMVLGSVELRQPIANALTGVVFVDVGSAWGGSFGSVNISGFKQDNGFTPHASIGLGIRVRTPLGPLRLDYGFGQEGGRAHFSIGNQF